MSDKATDGRSGLLYNSDYYSISIIRKHVDVCTCLQNFYCLLYFCFYNM